MSKTRLKDNIIFRSIIIPICIAMCLFGRFIPAFDGLSQDAMGVLFIFLGTLILWLTISIDWPSIVCIVSLAILPSLQLKDVLGSSFGNDTVIFLLFTFICTYALSKTSWIKRIAISFVNNKLAKKNGYLFMFFFLLSVLLVGLFISPSVLFVIMLPILDEILQVCEIDKKDKIAKLLMIGLGFTVSISSGMTPIAHVFPLMAIKYGHADVSFAQYLAIGMPTGILLFLLMYVVLALLIRPDVSKLKDVDVSTLKNELPKINKKDIWVLSIFIFIVLLWIVPTFFKGLSSEFDAIVKQYGTTIPPMLGAIAMFIIHVDKKPILTIPDSLKNGVPWSSIIMCAGALGLAGALTNKTIGIPDFLQTHLSTALAGLSGIILLIIFAIWAAVQTNLSSNIVTAQVVSAVAWSVLSVNSMGLTYEALICIIGMLASFAFATPPSMPHIAIVASSESSNTKEVLGYGTIVMLISIVLALLVAYPIGMLIF